MSVGSTPQKSADAWVKNSGLMTGASANHLSSAGDRERDGCKLFLMKILIQA
jgi:hypothetical protein